MPYEIEIAMAVAETVSYCDKTVAVERLSKHAILATALLEFLTGAH
jgi:hypothetical protein